MMTQYGRRLEQVYAQLFPQKPPRVMGGPFRGMVYVETSVGSELLPKLVGSYEAELAEVVERAIARGYDTVLNVGCAEGYYAVGLAMRMPKATVYAFDLDPNASRLCPQLAALNGVAERVILKGACRPATFAELVRGRTLIVCDCEGYELELLDPVQAPKLLETDILVELHGCSDPKISITDTVLARFRRTHQVTVIPVCKRDPAAFPLLNSLGPQDRKLAIDEFRSGTKEWGFMQRAS